jgi:FixJ family two-component response regulator
MPRRCRTSRQPDRNTYNDDSRPITLNGQTRTNRSLRLPSMNEVTRILEAMTQGEPGEQAAAALNISVRTANRHWAYARAWLYQQLNPPDDAAG